MKEENRNERHVRRFKFRELHSRLRLEDNTRKQHLNKIERNTLVQFWLEKSFAYTKMQNTRQFLGKRSRQWVDKETRYCSKDM